MLTLLLAVKETEFINTPHLSEATVHHPFSCVCTIICESTYCAVN